MTPPRGRALPPRAVRAHPPRRRPRASRPLRASPRLECRARPGLPPRPRRCTPRRGRPPSRPASRSAWDGVVEAAHASRSAAPGCRTTSMGFVCAARPPPATGPVTIAAAPAGACVTTFFAASAATPRSGCSTFANEKRARGSTPRNWRRLRPTTLSGSSSEEAAAPGFGTGVPEVDSFSLNPAGRRRRRVDREAGRRGRHVVRGHGPHFPFR